jgi:secondary thiamine-phosphate synthase enzyme
MIAAPCRVVQNRTMRQSQHTLTVESRGKGLIEITGEVKSWLKGQGIATGLLTLYCRHTSASLLIQENADPDVQTDLKNFFEDIAPEAPTSPKGEYPARQEKARRNYIHDTEGPDDMPAHIRTALTHTSLSIPVTKGALTLGTWQGIFLFEHRSSPHRREIVLHLIGE